MTTVYPLETVTIGALSMRFCSKHARYPLIVLSHIVLCLMSLARIASTS
jgi:hypothetical protein